MCLCVTRFLLTVLVKHWITAQPKMFSHQARLLCTMVGQSCLTYTVKYSRGWYARGWFANHQYTHTHTKKKHYELGYICLCVLQLSVSLHWCNRHTLTVGSTLLLYPNHLAGFLISTSAAYSHVCWGLNVRVDYLFSSPLPCLGTVKPCPVVSTEHGCCIKVSHGPTKLPPSRQSLEGLSTMLLGLVGHLGSHGGLISCGYPVIPYCKRDVLSIAAFCILFSDINEQCWDGVNDTTLQLHLGVSRKV